MAALVLSAAGAAIGGSVFGPVGAIAGRIAGAIGGNLIDQALFGSVVDRSLFAKNSSVQGPRLADLDVMASTEGAPIPRVYGRVRISGQVIWATRLEEAISTRNETTGGKGGMRRVYRSWMISRTRSVTSAAQPQDRLTPAPPWP